MIAYNGATVTTMTGGDLTAYGETVIASASGGMVNASDNVTISARDDVIIFAAPSVRVIGLAGGPVPATVKLHQSKRQRT